MKLQLPKEPHVVFLVSEQCEISFIWRDILTDIPAQQRQMAIYPVLSLNITHEKCLIFLIL